MELTLPCRAITRPLLPDAGAHDRLPPRTPSRHPWQDRRPASPHSAETVASLPLYRTIRTYKRNSSKEMKLCLFKLVGPCVNFSAILLALWKLPRRYSIMPVKLAKPHHCASVEVKQLDACSGGLVQLPVPRPVLKGPYWRDSHVGRPSSVNPTFAHKPSSLASCAILLKSQSLTNVTASIFDNGAAENSHGNVAKGQGGERQHGPRMRAHAVGLGHEDRYQSHFKDAGVQMTWEV